MAILLTGASEGPGYDTTTSELTLGRNIFRAHDEERDYHDSIAYLDLNRFLLMLPLGVKAELPCTIRPEDGEKMALNIGDVELASSPAGYQVGLDGLAITVYSGDGKQVLACLDDVTDNNENWYAPNRLRVEGKHVSFRIVEPMPTKTSISPRMRTSALAERLIAA